jgi:hypothetical protein
MQIPTTVAAFTDGVNAVAQLNGLMYPCKLIRVNLSGPAGSRAEIYIGWQKIDQTARGQSNTADYGSSPYPVSMGTPISVKWPNVGASFASCSATFTVER